MRDTQFQAFRILTAQKHLPDATRITMKETALKCRLGSIMIVHW